MTIRRKTSEEAGMAAVREVRALFASFEDSSAVPAELSRSKIVLQYLLSLYLPSL